MPPAMTRLERSFEVDSERHLNIGNNNGGNKKEAADHQVKLTKFQEWWQYEGLRIKWILVIVVCNVGIGLYVFHATSC